ncbi:MAG: ABC transporter permease [Nitrospirota bacterium]|nr:ABC transporter permease [Nitrospirota bacterium]
MNFMTTSRTALRALRQNKMRTGLTMLGIIIGVAAVITMTAVGEGARRALAKEISSLGSNILRVYPGTGRSEGVRSGDLTTLQEEDIAAIGAEIPEVEAAAPIARDNTLAIYGNTNWFTAIVGSTNAFLKARDWEVAEGRNFYPQEEEGSAKVCVIGQTVRDNLFFGEDPLGKTIRIKKIPFIIVGVLEKKGQSPIGRDQDDMVLVPLHTVQRKLLGITHVTDSWIKVRQASDLAAAQEKIGALLRQRHRIPANREDDFVVRNLTEILNKAEETSRIMAILLGSVAAVSLLVGGIGIMNIMLVSVTERTREIGVRMAVGAKESDISSQFLIEAVAISLIGGFVGTLLGIGASQAITTFFRWETFVSFQAILLAFAFSAGIGIFFGLYPARKAARLDPIEALRYE